MMNNSNKRNNKEQQRSKKEFEKLLEHEKEYKLLSIYVKNNLKVKILHKICNNIFEVTPHNFKNGQRCSPCNSLIIIKNQKSKKKFEELVEHQREYKLLSEYINCRTKVKILHLSCGNEFLVSPNRFKYGTRCPICAWGKRKKTNLERYGVEWSMQSINVQNKRKQTWLQNIGVENPSQSQEIIEKRQQTNLKKYGSIGMPHSEETKRKMRIIAINNIENRCGQVMPNYNSSSIVWFDSINKKYKLNGLHAENGGEYKIKKFGYFVDFFEPNLNLIIEWDEKYHNTKKQKEKDKLRDQEIECFYHYKIIRIKDGQTNLKLIEKEVKKIIDEKHCIII